MLWSPVSKTLAVHYICLNPYLFMTTGQLSFSKIMQDNFNMMRDQCYQKIKTVNEEDKEAPIQNVLGPRASNAPVFLKRNLKLMRKQRDLQ